MEKMDVERISSGIPFLDWALGGGWPMRRIVEIYGTESSGKTLTTLLTMAEAQKAGKSVVLIDAENSFDPAFAESLGVDLSKLIVSQSSIGESTMDIMLDVLKAEPDVVVLDSIAAMVPQAELDNPMDKDTMALTARVMGKALRKITAVNKHSLIIFVNQVRSSMALYGASLTTPGGRGVKHFCSVRVQIARGDFIKEKDEYLGQMVKFKVVKNKTAAPWRQGYYKFLYATDSAKPIVDRADSLVSMAILENTISRSGSFYSLGEHKYQGRVALEEALREDEKLYNELYEKTLAKGRKTNSKKVSGKSTKA